MTLFLKSLESRVFKAVNKEFKEPQGDENTWSELETKEFEVNSKAHYALMQALNDDDMSQVINCTSTYDVRHYLVLTHEDASQVKRDKIHLLCSQYENFDMNESESIDDMITRFTKITEGLSSLGDKIDNDQKVRKIIKPQLKSWKVKATTLKELNNKDEMKFMGLIGNLKTQEMEHKARDERNHKRRKL